MSHLKMMIKSKSINKALLMSWGGVIINFGGFLIILPIATSSLDLLDLNFWLYSTTLLAVGMIIESSIVNPFNRLLRYAKDSITIDNGKGHKSLNNINDSLYIMSRLTVIFAAFVFAVTYIVGLLSTTNFEQVSGINVYLFLISLICLFRVLSTFFISILHTEGMISIQKETQFYLLLLKTVITIIILYFFKSLALVFIINAIIVAIEFLIYIYITFKKLGYHGKLKKGKYNKNTLRSVKRPVANTLTIRVGGYFIAQSMAMLAMQLPVEESTLMLFSIKCISLVYRVSLMPFHVKLPTFVKYRANGEVEKIRNLYVKEMRLSIIVYIIGSISLVFLAKDIADFLDVKVYFLDTYHLLLMSLIFFLELHHVTHSMVYETTNDVPFVKISVLSGLLIFIIGFISNTLGYGITGLILTQFFVQFIGNNWYPVYLSLKSTNWKFGCYLKDMFGVNSDRPV